jgi:transposase
LRLNYGPELLDLPSAQPIACFKTKTAYEILVEILTPPPICPKCKSVSNLRPNGTQVRKIIDQMLHGLCVYLYFIRQRYQCSCGRNLLQPLPSIVKGRLITERAAQEIARNALTQSFEYIGAVRGLSPKTIKYLFAEYISALEAARTIECPEVLGIDGVCGSLQK